MIAGALVPQRLLDQDEVRGRPERRDLARRRHADQQATARDEHLLGNQYRVGCADGAAYDAVLAAAVLEAVKVAVVAAPGRIAGRRVPSPAADGRCRRPDRAHKWPEPAP